MRKKILVGNWKMFKTIEEATAFADDFNNIFTDSNHEVGICCSFISIQKMKEMFKNTQVKIGAQNMHYEDEGAYTGEISPGMLKELDIDYCIIGHSERRQYFNETDETVNKKIHKALETDINPILCVGEKLEDRDDDKEYDVVKKQIIEDLSGIPEDKMENIVIAYEPIWAIGTGRTATPEQAEDMCRFIRETVSKLYGDAVGESLRIQYGGSVKPGNAKELMTQPDIDGALVGGASLVPEDFIKIIEFDR